MTGTLINLVAIILGSSLGILFGARLSENLKNTVIAGMGLFTSAVGIQMFLKTENPLIVLGALIFGAILGEWMGVEEGLQGLGAWLEKRVMGDKPAGEALFVRGFLTASLVFCVGPMAILGSIQDGLTGDFQVLAVKSVLDAFAAMAFASSLGVGVIFSALSVLVYQGAITLLAAQVQSIVTAAMMTEMTATGGLILMGIAIGSLLEIKPIRAGNFLPALIIAPFAVWLLSLIHAL